VSLLDLRAGVLPAAALNRRFAAGRNKAEAAWERVAVLLRQACDQAQVDERILATVDKQGGRKFYASGLSELFAGELVEVREERSARSAYSLIRVKGGLTLDFLENAESRSFPVALASMVAKLTREIYVRRLNRFFRQRLPGLTPTAGYPADARRFLSQTEDLRRRLGLRDELLIRQR
jgi:ribonuclease HII